jgi:hypothetical protein
MLNASLCHCQLGFLLLLLSLQTQQKMTQNQETECLNHNNESNRASRSSIPSQSNAIIPRCLFTQHGLDRACKTLKCPLQKVSDPNLTPNCWQVPPCTQQDQHLTPIAPPRFKQALAFLKRKNRSQSMLKASWVGTAVHTCNHYKSGACRCFAC